MHCGISVLNGCAVIHGKAEIIPNLCRYERLAVVVHIVKRVPNYVTKRVVVVSWDTKPGSETSLGLNVKSRCAASRNEKSKPVPIVLIILRVK